MSLSQLDKTNLPPVSLMRKIRPLVARNHFWKDVANDSFEITGIDSSSQNPDDPLVMLKHLKHPAIQRTALLSKLQSDNGVELPSAQQLIDCFR